MYTLHKFTYLSSRAQGASVLTYIHRHKYISSLLSFQLHPSISIVVRQKTSQFRCFTTLPCVYMRLLILGEKKYRDSACLVVAYSSSSDPLQKRRRSEWARETPRVMETEFTHAHLVTFVSLVDSSLEKALLRNTLLSARIDIFLRYRIAEISPHPRFDSECRCRFDTARASASNRVGTHPDSMPNGIRHRIELNIFGCVFALNRLFLLTVHSASEVTWVTVFKDAWRTGIKWKSLRSSKVDSRIPQKVAPISR